MPCGALIVLAQQPDEIDEIMALELGAYDYIGAPFHPRRLGARLGAAVRALQARTQNNPASEQPALPMVHSGWSLDLAQALLRGNGHQLRLSAAQASVLALLAERAGPVVPRSAVARQLGLPRAPAGSGLGRAVDMHLNHLRRRRFEDGIAGLQIETLRGIGYLLRSRQTADGETPIRQRRAAPADGSTRLVAVG